MTKSNKFLMRIIKFTSITVITLLFFVVFSKLVSMVTYYTSGMASTLALVLVISFAIVDYYVFVSIILALGIQDMLTDILGSGGEDD